MAPKPQALLLLLPLLLLSPVTATDILEILNPLSDYSTFTKYLIEANLVDEINRRDNVTVLAVKNSEITPISSLPADVRKNVMFVHVLLGYYDPYSISHLPDKTSLVPTLFQTTGLAANQNGYVKVTVRPIREIIFGSATPGSPLESYLINVVGTDSDKVSVLHISDPIIPSGIDGARKTTAPVTTPPSASSPAKQVTPASSPAKQVTPAPAPMEKKAATGPANAPKAATGPANAPKASASSPSTGNVPEAPAAPPKEAGKAPTSPSSAGRVVVGATMGLAMGVVLLGVC